MVRLAVLSLIAVTVAACSNAPPKNTPDQSKAPPAAMTPATAAASSPGAAPPPAANAVDPATVQALRDMGTYLQSLKQFEVMVNLSGERVLADGQKLTHTATSKLVVQRPNKLRADMRSARSARDLIYDGKTVVLYQPEEKYYSTAPFTDNLGQLVGRLRERFGIEIPMADLFLWGTDHAPLDNMTSAMNAGQDFVDNTLCNHYAFRQGDIDWQIWVEAGSRPLPRKLVITNRTDDARPQSISLMRWNLSPKLSESLFTFKPPQGAKVAEFVPLKTK